MAKTTDDIPNIASTKKSIGEEEKIRLLAIIKDFVTKKAKEKYNAHKSDASIDNEKSTWELKGKSHSLQERSRQTENSDEIFRQNSDSPVSTLLSIY